MLGIISNDTLIKNISLSNLSIFTLGFEITISFFIFISFFNLKIDPLTVDAETLGGLFISEFGVLPEIEDKISIEKLIVKVSDTDGRRIKKFVVTTNT